MNPHDAPDEENRKGFDDALRAEERKNVDDVTEFMLENVRLWLQKADFVPRVLADPMVFLQLFLAKMSYDAADPASPAASEQGLQDAIERLEAACRVALPHEHALLVRLRLREAYERQGHRERAIGVAVDERTCALRADSAMLTLMGLAGLMPFFARVGAIDELATTFHELRNVGVPLLAALHSELDRLNEAAARKGPFDAAALRRIVNLGLCVEGAFNLALWSNVHVFLAAGLYDEACSMLDTRPLEMLRVLETSVGIDTTSRGPSLYRLLASYELSRYEELHRLPSHLGLSSQEWHQRALQRAEGEGTAWLPEEPRVAFYVQFAYILSRRDESVGTDNEHVMENLRRGLVARTALRWEPDNTQQRQAVEDFERSAGLRWPAYQSAMLTSDLV
jgi:hypothetical protein